MAEVEHRLGGQPPSPRLATEMAVEIPEAATYVLVLFDGLGDLQLDHPAARELARHRRGAVDAPFSTQTSVATATIATGLPPSQHGQIAYLMWDPDWGGVVNTLYGFALDGRELTDLQRRLPRPNLAERLAGKGVAATVVLAAGLAAGPLSRTLYRGANVVGVNSDYELVEATARSARAPGLVVVYVPDIDAAAHPFGQDSVEYHQALRHSTELWASLRAVLPSEVAMIGTADHGHVDVRPSRRLDLRPPRELVLHGDERVAYVKGDREIAAEYAGILPVRFVPVAEAMAWWGPPPYHRAFLERLPDALLVADPGYALRWPGNQIEMTGHHGGLTEDELVVPVLVG